MKPIIQSDFCKLVTMNKPLNRSFRNTVTLEEAENIGDVLLENGIVSRIAKNEGDLDYVFQGEAPTNKFELIINESDVLSAEKILSDLASSQLNQVSSDHYLFSFSNDELLKVLIEKNEWNEIDVLLSEKILTERGITIDYNELSEQRKSRNIELSKPKGGQFGWIIVGYISAILGGFLGLVIGYFIWKAKNTLPNGQKVPAYSEKSRKHGVAIFLISLIVFPTMVLLRVASDII
jgi:hypothetical protein